MATKKQRKAAAARLARDQEAIREQGGSSYVDEEPVYENGRKLTDKERRARHLISDDPKFWAKRDRNMRKLQISNARNTRIMFVRYAVAIVFFVNLYWFSMLLTSGGGWFSLMPVANLVLSGAAAAETFVILHRDVLYLKITHYAMIASIVLDTITISITLFVGKDVFFPFFSSGYVGAVACALFLALKVAIVAKVLRVRDCQDKAYDRYVEIISEH